MLQSKIDTLPRTKLDPGQVRAGEPSLSVVLDDRFTIDFEFDSARGVGAKDMRSRMPGGETSLEGGLVFAERLEILEVAPASPGGVVPKYTIPLTRNHHWYHY